jgi:hypothetical protein
MGEAAPHAKSHRESDQFHPDRQGKAQGWVSIPSSASKSTAISELRRRKLSYKTLLFASLNFAISCEMPPAGVSPRLLNVNYFHEGSAWFCFRKVSSSCKMRLIASSDLDCACQNRKANSSCHLWSASISCFCAMFSASGAHSLRANHQLPAAVN